MAVVAIDRETISLQWFVTQGVHQGALSFEKSGVANPTESDGQGSSYVYQSRTLVPILKLYTSPEKAAEDGQLLRTLPPDRSSSGVATALFIDRDH